MLDVLPLSAPEISRQPMAHYKVVVIGGGINGVGVFRDLCEQGVPCLLLEKSDFCSGASAAPSRLIHGGIKYLETGEFRLVRQSTLERNRLLVSAPHYVKPIETVVPARSWTGGVLTSIARFLGRKSKLTERGFLILATGVLLFDWYGRHHRTMPRATFRWGRRFRKSFPGMAPGIHGAAIYYDAKITSPERLGLELVLDGMAACSESLALNYATVEAVQDGALFVRDTINGAMHRVSTELVINAAGAWIDRANRTLGIESSYIGGQKGSHIVLENEQLRQALGSRMVYFGASDGRVALLYEYLGNVLVGSTDLPVGDADGAACDDHEVDYMLSAVREIFPDADVSRDQVRYRYSGVRPLPRSATDDPGSVSRDHSLRRDTIPDTDIAVWSLIGGKWTTFRGFAEEVVDEALRLMKLPRIVDTSVKPIGGGRNYPRNDAEKRSVQARLRQGIGDTRARCLFQRYGTRALEVAGWCSARGDIPLATCPSYSRAEIEYLTLHEMAHRLSDVIYRRTDIALSGHLTPDAVHELAEIVGRCADWDSIRVGREKSDVFTEARTAHGLDLQLDHDPEILKNLTTQAAECGSADSNVATQCRRQIGN